MSKLAFNYIIFTNDLLQALEKKSLHDSEVKIYAEEYCGLIKAYPAMKRIILNVLTASKFLNHQQIYFLLATSDADFRTLGINHAFSEPYDVCAREIADVPDAHDLTPLDYFARAGDYKLMSFLLLKSDVNINRVNKYGQTPLISACYGGHFDVVQLLVFYGAEVNVQIPKMQGVYSRCQPLHLTVRDDPDIAKFLIEFGADVNARDLFGYTPLHEACCRDRTHVPSIETIRLLIDSGADVNALDSDGYTPLHFAIQSYCDLDIINLLVRAGANIEIGKNSALQTAVKYQRLDAVIYLVSCGADLTKTNFSHFIEDENIILKKDICNYLGKHSITTTDFAEEYFLNKIIRDSRVNKSLYTIVEEERTVDIESEVVALGEVTPVSPENHVVDFHIF